MAKLKAPLLSLGASGQLGKAIVFFTWKGLNVAREYVIPSNPKTSGQTTQRGYLTTVVANIHGNMAHATRPLTEADKSSLALWGSTWPTPRTWFNTLVKNGVEQLVKTLYNHVHTVGLTTPGAGSLAVSICDNTLGILTAKFYYGTSKTAMLSSIDADIAAGTISKTIPSLTAGVKYYWQLRPLTPAAYVGAYSGIYHGTPT